MNLHNPLTAFMLFLLMTMTPGLPAGATPSDLDPMDIMEKVDELSRLTFHRSFSKSTLSTCKFGKKNNKLVCVTKPRQKVLESVQKQYGDALKDSKALSIVLEPPSERGIGMLTYQYDDPDQDTESWLYLSALGKVKRMVSGSEEEQEPVSFFGSEFTTEDMESGKVDEFTYALLKETEYRQRPVWVIEAIPKPARLKKTFYSRLIMWVDRDRYLMLKSHAYDKKGLLMKRITASNIRQVNAYWLAHDITVINQQSQRLSKLKTLDVALDVAVTDEFLTQRSLTDFAYREKELARLRQSTASP